MNNIHMRFPGGKNKALTLSYDDGVEQDVRLMDIMKKNGLKGTFNINSGEYPEEGTVFEDGWIHRRLTKKAAKELYAGSGMEVAVHGLTHPFLEQLPENICTYEILQDRINLEEEYGCIVRGMAYPFGTYSDEVVECAKMCGIVYARTVQETERFEIPDDWMRLKSTCHHNNPKLMELSREFVGEHSKYGKAEDICLGAPKLFYLWGHSYEFEANDNWNVIEEFADYIGGREDIWYATNIEIYDYIVAYNQLIFSTEATKVYNPTAYDIYFVAYEKMWCVKSGEVLMIEDMR